MNQRQGKTSVNHIAVLSFNHQTISLEDLRPFVFEDGELQSFLEELKTLPGIDDALGLCTCNRVEMYLILNDIDAGIDAAVAQLSRRNQSEPDALRSSMAILVDTDAVRHLARLASGLESMVAGDAQILGQLKKSYYMAKQAGEPHRTIHVLFQKVFSIAKRVRNETGLGKGRVSISAIAVEFAVERFGHLFNTRAAVIGAGKMSSLAAKYLASTGVKELRIVNRTYEKALELAQEVRGAVYGIDELERALEGVDVVISGTASTEPVLTRELFESERLKENPPRLVIDIALPADAAPDLGDVAGVEVIALEDLRQCAKKNQASRMDEVGAAESIVNEELKKLGPWPLTATIDRVARDLGNLADRIFQEELNALLSNLTDLTPDQQTAVSARMKRLAERIVLAPRRNLRRGETLKSCPEAGKCLAEVFRESHGARSQQVVAVEPARVAKTSN